MADRYDNPMGENEGEPEGSLIAVCWAAFKHALSRPAAHCCLFVPLVRGVRLISLYTLATGFLYLPRVNSSSTDGLPKDVGHYRIYLTYMEWVFNLTGIIMGFQGLLGLKTNNAGKLRYLFIYYLLKLVLEIPVFAWHEAYMCLVVQVEVEKYPNRKHPSCDEARRAYQQFEIVQAVMMLVFAHAVWSLAKRIETDDYEGLEFNGQDLGNNYLNMPLMTGQSDHNIMFAGAWDAGQGPLAPPTAPTQRPRVGRSIEPFSGQAFRLDP